MVSVCSTCGKSFSRKDSLERHKRTVHGKLKRNRDEEETEEESEEESGSAESSEEEDGEEHSASGDQEEEDGDEEEEAMSPESLNLLMHLLQNALFMHQEVTLKTVRKMAESADPELLNENKDETSSEGEESEDEENAEGNEEDDGNEKKVLGEETIIFLQALVLAAKRGVFVMSKSCFLEILDNTIGNICEKDD